MTSLIDIILDIGKQMYLSTEDRKSVRRLCDSAPKFQLRNISISKPIFRLVYARNNS